MDTQGDTTMNPRVAFIAAQVAGERLAFKTIQLANKNMRLKMPHIEDMTRRYVKLYDDIEIAIDKIDGEDND